MDDGKNKKAMKEIDHKNFNIMSAILSSNKVDKKMEKAHKKFKCQSHMRYLERK